MTGFYKRRLGRSPDKLIASLPDKVGDWKKFKSLKTGFLGGKKTVYYNEKKSSFVIVRPPSFLNREYIFEASILGDHPEVVELVFDANVKSLRSGLVSVIKMANVWHKNRVATLKLVGAPKGMFVAISHDVRERVK
jgi:hypothetical protein